LLAKLFFDYEDADLLAAGELEALRTDTFFKGLPEGGRVDFFESCFFDGIFFSVDSLDESFSFIFFFRDSFESYFRFFEEFSFFFFLLSFFFGASCCSACL
jgi:hypothetical protein